MYYDRESWEKLSDMRRKALVSEHVAEDAAFYARRRAAKAQAREAWAKQKAEAAEWDQFLAEEAAERLAAEIKPQPVASTPEITVSGKRSGKASKISRVKARPKVKRIRVKARKPQAAPTAKKERRTSVIQMNITGKTVLNPVSKGLYALTAEGERMVEELSKDGDRNVIILRNEESVMAVLALSDFELMGATLCIEGKARTLVRVRNEDVLEGLRGVSPDKFDTSSMTWIWKRLTRQARAKMGIRAPGTTHEELEYEEVGISLRDARRAHLRAGDWVLVGRFPQGSCQKAFHWAKIVIVRGLESGIQLNPLAMLVLGGDGDGDEYYIIKCRGAHRSRGRYLNIMTAEEVLIGADNPNMLLVTPEQKLSDGFEDRMKELERSAIGPFTTMAYQAISLVGPEIADLFLPSLELVFDVRKLKSLGISFLVESAAIMQFPIRTRYSLLAELADRVVSYLDGNKDAEVDAYYLDAFRALHQGAAIAHVRANEFAEGLKGHAEWAHNIAPEFSATAFPVLDAKNLLSLQAGKGCAWQGLQGCLSTLIAKNRGEGAEEVQENRKVAHLLFGTTVAKCEAGMTYLRGNDTSQMAIRVVDASREKYEGYYLQVLHRFQGTYNQITCIDENIWFDIPVDMAAPVLSHKLVTGIMTKSRIINARVTNEGILSPLGWYVKCVTNELDKAWGEDIWMQENLRVPPTRVHDLGKILRAAEVEWKRYSVIPCKGYDGFTFQLKAVSIEDGIQSSALEALKDKLGNNWEFRSTKNPDKGYIVPTLSNPKYAEVMKLWFKAEKFSHLISMNRVLREQLPCNNIGQGWANVLVFNKTSITRSECASSWDALLMDRGEEFNHETSQSDVSIMFRPREYSRKKTVQLKGYYQVMEAIHQYSDQGWDVDVDDHSFPILNDKNQEMLITDDRGYRGYSVVEVTLHLTQTDVTKQGHSYKWMCGGAKGMAVTAFEQTVTALTANGEIEIDAAISGDTLHKKNGLHWVLEGSRALLGQDLGEDTAEHIAAHVANGADSTGQYPVYVDGKLVGNFTILRVPYWMLPTMSEHQGTRVGDQPWVAPTSRVFAPEVALYIPRANMVAAMQSFTKVTLNHVTKRYIKWQKQGHTDGNLIHEQMKEITRVIGDIKNLSFEDDNTTVEDNE